MTCTFHISGSSKSKGGGSKGKSKNYHDKASELMADDPLSSKQQQQTDSDGQPTYGVIIEFYPLLIIFYFPMLASELRIPLKILHCLSYWNNWFWHQFCNRWKCGISNKCLSLP